MKKDCSDCMWADSCAFERPCHYFTPLDYEERLEDAEAARSERRYREEWIEYAEYCDDIFFD